MMRKHGSRSLGMYRRIYIGNLTEQSLLGRWYHRKKEGVVDWLRERKSPDLFTIIKRMQSALMEKEDRRKAYS